MNIKLDSKKEKEKENEIKLKNNNKQYEITGWEDEELNLKPTPFNSNFLKTPKQTP